MSDRDYDAESPRVLADICRRSDAHIAKLNARLRAAEEVCEAAEAMVMFAGACGCEGAFVCSACNKAGCLAALEKWHAAVKKARSAS